MKKVIIISFLSQHVKEKLVVKPKKKRYNKSEKSFYKNIIEGDDRSMLYDYLKETYGENEPIFVAEIQYKGQSLNYIRQQIKKLTDEGRLKRYDTGIYFIPKKSVFKSGSQLSRDRVIEKKYLKTNGERCGYVGGLTFANELGLTTQVSAVCEVYTNKASNDFRKIELGSTSVIIRKPRAKVTEQNFRQLQLLDLLKDIEFYAEVEDKEQKNIIFSYITKSKIRSDDLKKYLPYYPAKVYKNMYKVGLLDEKLA